MSKILDIYFFRLYLVFINQRLKDGAIMNDNINRLARACKVPVSVAAVVKEGATVTIYARGTINDNSRAFLGRFFFGLSVFVTEA